MRRCTALHSTVNVHVCTSRPTTRILPETGWLTSALGTTVAPVLAQLIQPLAALNKDTSRSRTTENSSARPVQTFTGVNIKRSVHVSLSQPVWCCGSDRQSEDGSKVGVVFTSRYIFATSNESKASWITRWPRC